MKYDLILIRYSEIGLKGKLTRKNFVKILTKNIKNCINKEGINPEITIERGRIFLKTKNIDLTLKKLQKIFGIKSFSPVIKTDSDIKSISNKVIEFAKSNLQKNKSFALRVNRTGEHNFSSMDIAVKMGDLIVKEMGNPVNLTNPDFQLFIDIRDEFAYIFKEKIYGVGGLPLGSQGNVLTLATSPDSLLAGWHLMKRGCVNYFLTSNTKIFESTKKFCDDWCNKTSIDNIDFQKKLIQQINDFVKKNNCSAVVTKDCLYKNDKLLDELLSLKKEISVPVLHPLIVMHPDKIEKKLHSIEVIN